MRNLRMFFTVLTLCLGVLWGGVEQVQAQASSNPVPATWGTIKAMYNGKADPEPAGVGRAGIDQVWAPINPWEPIGGYGFLRYVSGRGYHLGDDCVRSAGTAVYAMCDGYVRYARYNNGGWGYLMIVESTISGTTFCVVYGHLGATMYPGEGKNVGRGQYIGTVGSTAESGQSTPHLHLGVHYGAYGASTGTYPSWCRGYASSYISGWEWPTLFIQAW